MQDRLRGVFWQVIAHYENEQRIIAPMWEDIEHAYSGEGRFYHKLGHLDHMLSQLLEVKHTIRHWDIVILALCYHDFVYEPLRKDNEEKSAALAEKVLSTLAIHHSKIKRVVEMILATKQHQKSPDPDIDLFTDADLSILGSNEGDYNAYAQNIRREYAALPDALYIPGRIKVLEHFLAMSSIYKTGYFKAALEDRARRNLEMEKQQLSV